MRYYRFPKWLRIFYPGAVWDIIDPTQKIIYLTFDDGPHPETTPQLLELLTSHQVPVTFFCLGTQVSAHPALFSNIKNRGHAIGNHGMNHLNGLKTNLKTYLENIEKAASLIDSRLFRPPYGRITPRQFKKIKRSGYHVIFWSLMTYDFDQKLDTTVRINMIKSNTKAGDIVVFHDNPKAIRHVLSELPLLIEFWKKEGYTFRTILSA